MNILLFTPHIPRQSVRMNHLISCEPLELEYLYTVLKDKHAVSFLVDGKEKDLIKVLSGKRYDLICMSCYITQIPDVHKISITVKAKFPGIYLVAGGVHAEVAPEHFFIPSIDAVVFGNHMQAIQQISDAVSRGIHPDQTEGVAFLKSGFRLSPLQKLMPEVPVTDRILLKKHPEKYYYFYYDQCASVKTAFGCPNTCNFCFCRQMNGGVYYARPIPEVVDEIKQIESDNIFLLDDNFLTRVKRLEEFCDSLEKENIQKKFIAYGTADFISKHPDTIKRLNKNGLSALIVGFEYITDAALHQINKKATVTDNLKTVSICRELNIDLFALFICNPDWKHRDFLHLAKYLFKNNIQFATFSTPTILPNTGEAIQQHVKFDTQNLWRYDLLRLHAKPAHISPFSYYLWLYILYLIPAFNFSTMQKLMKNYGFVRGMSVTLKSAISGAEYFIKILIYK